MLAGVTAVFTLSQTMESNVLDQIWGSQPKADKRQESEVQRPQADSTGVAVDEPMSSSPASAASSLGAILQELAGHAEAPDAALRQAREAINRELEQRARRALEVAADQYMAALGKDEGMRTMAEHLCRHIAPSAYSGGWDGIVKHMVKISG